MIEREATPMRRDELLRYLMQRRDRSVFWNDRQLPPSQAISLARRLSDRQVARVRQQYVFVEPAP